jgi:DNA-binding response OmpR family regulator
VRLPFDQGGHRPPPTVLLVDTDSQMRRMFSEALRQEGCAILEAATFEDGKRLWTRDKPEVLIVDVRLGQFNGLQLLMRARSDRPDLHAIITCPFQDAVLEAETNRFGGTFLLKPIEPWQIVRAVRNASAQTGPVPEPKTPPFLIERRRVDRRVLAIPDFHPDRRGADRRTPAQLSSDERRRGDRRTVLMPDFFPDRRAVQRRRLSK